MASDDREKNLIKILTEIKYDLSFIKNIVEKRLLGEDVPLPDEKREIAEYEKKKLKGETIFINLNEISKDV
ncbi:MAG: hypothetical protein ACP6IQ_07425 [Candidatus Njordarchaeia archaeon]